MRGPIIAFALGLAMLGCGIALLIEYRAQEQAEREDAQVLEAIMDRYKQELEKLEGAQGRLDAALKALEEAPNEEAKAEATRLRDEAEADLHTARELKRLRDDAFGLCAGATGPRSDAVEKQVWQACWGD